MADKKERRIVALKYVKQAEIDVVLEKIAKDEEELKELRRYKICNNCGKEYDTYTTAKYCCEDCRLEATAKAKKQD